jgi:uncharacterized membrane protein
MQKLDESRDQQHYVDILSSLCAHRANCLCGCNNVFFISMLVISFKMLFPGFFPSIFFLLLGTRQLTVNACHVPPNAQGEIMLMIT